MFAFASSQDPDNTVLIIDSNPTSAPPPIEAQARGPEFYPGAVYRINVDTDGDAHADVAFTFVFSEYDNGGQTGTGPGQGPRVKTVQHDPDRLLIRHPVPACHRVPRRAQPGQVLLAGPPDPLPTAVNRSFPAAVNAQMAIATRQASG